MQGKRKIDIGMQRHMAFAAVGGFFGAYAILCRCGVLANAQTMNLLELVISALRGDVGLALLHLGGLAVYVLGTMLTVFLPHFFGADMGRVAPWIDAGAAVLLGFLPADMPLLLGLYPIFFAMSVQWSSFQGARGFNSSSIFSTNNTKQASLALAEYLCDRDRSHFRKANTYLLTLLAFHTGAVLSFLSVQLLGIRGVWLNLPLIALAYVQVCREEAEARRTGEMEAEAA